MQQRVLRIRMDHITLKTHSPIPGLMHMSKLLVHILQPPTKHHTLMEPSGVTVQLGHILTHITPLKVSHSLQLPLRGLPP